MEFLHGQHAKSLLRWLASQRGSSVSEVDAQLTSLVPTPSRLSPSGSTLISCGSPWDERRCHCIGEECNCAVGVPNRCCSSSNKLICSSISRRALSMGASAAQSVDKQSRHSRDGRGWQRRLCAKLLHCRRAESLLRLQELYRWFLHGFCTVSW